MQKKEEKIGEVFHEVEYHADCICIHAPVKVNPGGTPGHPQDSVCCPSDYTWDSDSNYFQQMVEI